MMRIVKNRIFMRKYEKKEGERARGREGVRGRWGEGEMERAGNGEKGRLKGKNIK